MKLEKFNFNKKIGKHWYGNRVVDDWNKLASDVIDANMLARSKC